MSNKIVVEMKNIGNLDTMSNPILVNGNGCRLLQDAGDLDGDGVIKTQPGVSNVLGSPLLANYTTGTVTTSNGSQDVAGSGTSWLTNAFPGDVITLADGLDYTIESVSSDTALKLRSKYAGTGAAGESYTIKHRVWMMSPFFAAGGTEKKSSVQKYDADTSTGTLTNTRAYRYGIGLAPDFEGITDNTTMHAVAVGASGTTDAGKFATQFELSSEITVNGIFSDVQNDISPSIYSSSSYSIRIETNSASNTPSGTLVHANATTGTVSSTTQSARAGSPSVHWHDFGGDVTLSASTKYWYVISHISPSSNALFYQRTRTISSSETNTGITINKSIGYVNNTSAWQSSYIGSFFYKYRATFWFAGYPTSGTNTYLTPIIDIGYTPTANGTLTIEVSTNQASAVSRFFTAFPETLTTSWVNSENAKPDTLTWELNCSANSDMSSPTQVATAQTALNYTITGAGNLKRYYQVTYSFTSATGRSTPLVSGTTIFFESTPEEASEGNKFLLVGCGKNIYTQAKSGAGTISTSSVPTGAEVRATVYQGRIFWTSSGQAPQYWDGVLASAAAVSALAQSDGTAGVDPPARCRSSVLHNDKMFWYGDVGIQYYALANDSITDTVLTDASANFSTTGTGLQRFRLYPDVTNWPLRWYVISANNSTTLTCTGTTMTSIGDNGDNYLVTRNYRKAVWYSEETEPADTPTTNFLKFGDDDGDTVQAMLSWKGRLMVICQNQIWRVTGYGPTTPWDKDIIAKTGGTLSPMSVIATEDSLYWWSTEGIVEHSGGYGGVTTITERFRDLIVDDLNENLRDEVTGVFFNGQCFWSYPSAGSYVNDKTIIYNPSTNRWCIRSFGMYTPCVLVDENNEEVMYFWNPETACISKYDETTVSLPNKATSFDVKTSFIACSDPVEDSEWHRLRAVVKSDGSEVIGVSWAADYNDTTYTSVGQLVPSTTKTSGRTGVNSTDQLYLCQFDKPVRGSSLSIELTCSPSNSFEIRQLELVADPVESNTNGT